MAEANSIDMIVTCLLAKSTGRLGSGPESEAMYEDHYSI
jgi:hypothetical protein